jgi:hypothetical protein
VNGVYIIVIQFLMMGNYPARRGGVARMHQSSGTGQPEQAGGKLLSTTRTRLQDKDKNDRQPAGKRRATGRKNPDQSAV